MPQPLACPDFPLPSTISLDRAVLSDSPPETSRYSSPERQACGGSDKRIKCSPPSAALNLSFLTPHFLQQIC
ncbi:hypothetical protein RRG08_008299 [Elysia crispata]|uniref:Uncharacterized protein n=1 Tax=Elysia crispata TaxID=231223 RepID=A0AAE0ZNI1_9GAST|nr:hypothetical protein RRG08_008299 [Elysia crispata]